MTFSSSLEPAGLIQNKFKCTNFTNKHFISRPLPPLLQGYYQLGDIATKTEVGVRGPTGYLIKAREENETNDHIRLPLYFSLVWRTPYQGQCFTLDCA